MLLNELEYKFLGLINKKSRNGQYLMKKLRLNENDFKNLVNTRTVGYALCCMDYGNMSKTIACITPEGKAIFEIWYKDNRRNRTTRIIAIISLIISLTAILPTIRSLLGL